MTLDGELSVNSTLDGEFGTVLAPSADKHYAYEQAQPSDIPRRAQSSPTANTIATPTNR